MKYGYIAAGLLLVASHWYAYESGGDNGEAHVQNKYLKDYTESLQAARDKEQSLQAKLKEANDGYVSRQSRLIADARRSADAASGLRNKLADYEQRIVTEQALRRYTQVLGNAFGECTQELTAMGEIAGRGINAAQTLDEAWPQ